MRLEVFDPVLCCATGVCGPRVDPALLRIASHLRWVEAQGGQVRRYNLGQNPAAFAENELVRRELGEHGDSVLPLVLVDGQVALRGRYPTRDELAAWLGTGPAPHPEAACSGDSSGSGAARGSC